MLSGLSGSFLNQFSFALALFSGGLFPLGGGWPPAAPGLHPTSLVIQWEGISFFSNSKQRVPLS